MDALRLFRSAREYLTPQLQESAFIERGILTPDEFVMAGDKLVHTCPGWSWCAGDEKNMRSYLPRDKQYLVTKSVPSYRRATAMMADTIQENMVDGKMDENDDTWCAPSVSQAEENSGEEILVDGTETKLSAEDSKPPSSEITPANDDEYDDMEAYEDDAVALDDAVASSGAAVNDRVMAARRYDVSITYDNYYRTPRVFLFGYNEVGSPLSPERIFDDIMQDYANRTVTIENHPHTGRAQASIHPCQHGAAMKRVLEALQQCDAVPTVDQYLFIFLKFMQSVIPTIEYDYTMGVQLRGSDNT